MKQTTIILLILFQSALTFAQNYTISGRITEAKSGEDLVGSTVIISGTTMGVSTNAYGFYSLTIPKGEYKLIYRYLGYEDVVKTVS